MNELTHVMPEAEARRLTERIRIAAVNYTDAKDKLLHLVTQAKEGAAHESLGYASWTAYLAEVLGDEPLRLARDDRQEMVKVLSAEGMSTRAIAPIVGASQMQVVRDIKQGETFVSPVPPNPFAEPVGDDGLTHSERTGLAEKYESAIMGRDGKTYTRPEPNVWIEPETPAEPAGPKRPALTEQIFHAVYDLGKVIDRLNKLTDDDRFPRNKEKAALKHESDLIRYADTLNSVIAKLNN